MPRKPNPERDAARNAARLARDDSRRAARDYVERIRDRAVAKAQATQAALDAIRGEPLQLPGEVDYTQLPTMAQVTWGQMQALLVDLAMHGSSERMRARAAVAARDGALNMLAHIQEHAGAQQQPSAAAVRAQLTDDQVHVVRDLLAQKRQLMRKASGE